MAAGTAAKSQSRPHGGGLQHVRLLDVDPQLGYELPPDQLQAARGQLVVGLAKRPAGDWKPAFDPQGSRPMMIISSGFLLRATELGGRRSAQLLGPGDFIAPVQEPDVAEEAPPTWRFLTSAALIVLDDRALARVSAFPRVSAALMHRWGAQAQRAAVQMDIVKQSHIEMRVTLMLWHFTQRWGRVLPEGVLLPLPLTHAVLGQLVGARRPTVSLAVKQLEREGALSRASGGAWLLDDRFLSEVVAPRPRRAARAVRETTPAPGRHHARPPAAVPASVTSLASAAQAGALARAVIPAQPSEVELLRSAFLRLRREHELTASRTAENLRRNAQVRQRLALERLERTQALAS